MPVLIGILIVITVVTLLTEWWAQSETVAKIGSTIGAVATWFANNTLLIIGVAFILVGIYLYFIFIPHKAEKFFESYKKGLISRKEAIAEIGQTFYNHTLHGLPKAWESKLITVRLKMLRKRVKEETGFMEELISYMRLKAKKGE
jgi:hypothetical protein